MVSVNFQNSASFSRYSHRKFSQMVIFRNCLFKKFIGHVLDNLMAAIWSSSQFSNIMSIYNCFSAFKCQINTGLLKLSFAQFQPSSYSYYYFLWGHFFFITSNSWNSTHISINSIWTKDGGSGHRFRNLGQGQNLGQKLIFTAISRLCFEIFFWNFACG